MNTEIAPDYISERIKKIDNEGFIYLSPLLNSTAQEFIGICEKSGIKKSEIIIYSTFVNLALTQINSRVSEKLIEKFAKIPPKKKKSSIRDAKTVRWFYIKMARLFYQPLSNSNLSDEEKASFGHIPCYHLMGYYVAKLFKESMTYLENMEAFEEIIRRRRPYELTKGFLGCFFSFDNAHIITECMEKIVENDLFEDFATRINEEVINACGYLMKFANKDAKLDDYIEEMDMAQELLAEINENVLMERDQYSKLVQEYEHTIKLKQQLLEKYKLQFSVLQIKNAHLKDNPLLKGLSVLVIGDTGRKMGYKKLVESYGGEFHFLDGIQEGKQSRRMALKCDIVFQLTDYSKHLVSNQIKEFSHIVLVDRVGIDNLEQAILECEHTLLKKYNQETGA